MRIQKYCIWYTLVAAGIYFVGLYMVHLFPATDPGWSSAHLAQQYQDHTLRIKIGALITALSGGFFIPFICTICVQLYRHEKLDDPDSPPLWSLMAAIGGTLMVVIIAMPPTFFGVAAFAADRSPDVTAALHQCGVFFWLTGDWAYIFLCIGMAVVCLKPHAVPHSPFTRWLGYCVILSILGTEPSVLPFIFHTGPLSWNGVIGYWLPVIPAFLIFTIPAVIAFMRALNGQIGVAQVKSSVPPEPVSV
jgi:hypothetical protein